MSIGKGKTGRCRLNRSGQIIEGLKLLEKRSSQTLSNGAVLVRPRPRPNQNIRPNRSVRQQMSWWGYVYYQGGFWIRY